MDLVPLIDTLGESGTALAGGAVLGLLFGFFAQRTAFCTRSAVLDLTTRRGSLCKWICCGLNAAREPFAKRWSLAASMRRASQR